MSTPKVKAAIYWDGKTEERPCLGEMLCWAHLFHSPWSGDPPWSQRAVTAPGSPWFTTTGWGHGSPALCSSCQVIYCIYHTLYHTHVSYANTKAGRADERTGLSKSKAGQDSFLVLHWKTADPVANSQKHPPVSRSPCDHRKTVCTRIPLAQAMATQFLFQLF